MACRKLVNTKGMSREEWKKWRRRGIGGSDVASILGFNAYKNELTVFLEKTGTIDDSVEENFKMKMGNVLEPVVAELFAEEHPEFKIVRNNFMLQHATIDCMLANLDREIICPVRGKGVLEIKTTGEFNKKKWTSTGVPDDYMFQVQHYLAVTGYKFAYLAVLIGGNTEYKSYLIERDEKIISYIETKAVEFWGKVMTGEMPEVDGSDVTKEAVSRLYPADSVKAETVTLPKGIDTILLELSQISDKEDELKERKQYLQALVKLELGDNETGRIGSYWVNWKPQTKNLVDSAKLKKEYPEIHAAVLKQSQSRPFTFSYKEA